MSVLEITHSDIQIQSEEIPLELLKEVREEVTLYLKTYAEHEDIPENDFNTYTYFQKEKIFKILSFHICNSEEEEKLFWESLIFWALVCIINKKEVGIEKPVFSFKNYTSMLEVFYFFQSKKILNRTKGFH